MRRPRQAGSFAGTTIKDGPEEVEQLGRSFVILGQVGQPGVDRQPNSDGDVAVRVGLSIDARLTYLTEDDVRPAELLDFIGAVRDGGAREGAVLCPRRSRACRGRRM